MFRVVRSSLKASDTHCGHGETCMSEKYCPKDAPYNNGVCGTKERYNPDHAKYIQFNQEYKAEQSASRPTSGSGTGSSKGFYHRTDAERARDRNSRR
jgi:hypothetical protein